MSGKKFRKCDQEFIILPPGKPTYYEPNPFTGSKRQCKYRVASFIWMYYTHVLFGLHCLFSDGIITFKVM